MSRFEILVEKLRAAQIAYNEKPTGDNLNAVAYLEEKVDNYLEFCRNCHEMTFNNVKKYLNTAGL